MEHKDPKNTKILLLRVGLTLLNLALRLVGCWVAAQCLVLVLCYPLLGMALVEWQQMAVLAILVVINVTARACLLRGKANAQGLGVAILYFVAGFSLGIIPAHTAAQMPTLLAVLLFGIAARNLLMTKIQLHIVKK